MIQHPDSLLEMQYMVQKLLVLLSDDEQTRNTLSMSYKYYSFNYI